MTTQFVQEPRVDPSGSKGLRSKSGELLTQRLETMLNQAERRAVVAALRSRPELTLEKLQDFFRGRYGATLRTITVRELMELETVVFDAADPTPAIDRVALEEAKRLSGDAFDRCLLEVIRQAGGLAVSASYMRARVGGPRWKLQASLRRLVDLGVVERTGVTSSTRYRSTKSSTKSQDKSRVKGIPALQRDHAVSAPRAAG